MIKPSSGVQGLKYEDMHKCPGNLHVDILYLLCMALQDQFRMLGAENSIGFGLGPHGGRRRRGTGKPVSRPETKQSDRIDQSGLPSVRSCRRSRLFRRSTRNFEELDSGLVAGRHH